MSDPVKVDSHVHVYRDRPEAIREKTGYEIWEYGALEGVHASDAIGLIDDFLTNMRAADIANAGWSWGVVHEACQGTAERIGGVIAV